MLRRLVALVLCLLSFVVPAQPQWVRYRVLVPDQFAAQRVADSPLGLFSEAVTLGSTDLIAAPNQTAEILRLGLPFWRVQELPSPYGWAKRRPQAADYRTNYLRYDAIIAQCEQWRALYPNVVTRQAIGVTVNGRTVWAYNVVKPWFVVTGPRISFVFIGGTHAREWIGPAVTMHLFHLYAEGLASGNTFLPRSAVGRVTATFIPVLNPDGYEYSWTNDRYWRKNRRPNGDGTFGVDLNRNYATAWGGAGSSGWGGSDVYRGPAPFSEPETRGVQTMVGRLPTIAGFIDLHSYGQQVLYPWSYTTDPTQDAALLDHYGSVMAQAIHDRSGKAYECSQSSTGLYLSAGCGEDWFYDVRRAMAYTIEMRDDGTYGFLLPEDQIAPTQDEIWAAYRAFLSAIVR